MLMCCDTKFFITQHLPCYPVCINSFTTIYNNGLNDDLYNVRS